MLSKTTLEAEGGKLTWQPLLAPASGTLRKIEVSPDQTVAAGTLLFEIIEHDRLWIRVPVFGNLTTMSWLPGVCETERLM